MTSASEDDEIETIGPDDLTDPNAERHRGRACNWLALVYSTLRDPGNFLIVSSGPPDLYVQALNHDGRFVLEYRDGSPTEHFQAADVSLAAIADALSQWMRGDRAFMNDHEWNRLSI